MRPLKIQAGLDALPTEAKARHEALVDIFAQHLFWARNAVLASSRGLAESAQERQRLGRLFRTTFENLGNLEPPQREAAYDFTKACLDSFARELLRLIGNEGLDLKLGVQHALKFHLDVEILDTETGDVVESETISSGGDKFLPDYWGRWLNRYGSGADRRGQP
jgi:hypothetical protein